MSYHYVENLCSSISPLIYPRCITIGCNYSLDQLIESKELIAICADREKPYYFYLRVPVILSMHTILKINLLFFQSISSHLIHNIIAWPLMNFVKRYNQYGMNKWYAFIHCLFALYQNKNNNFATMRTTKVYTSTQPIIID